MPFVVSLQRHAVSYLHMGGKVGLVERKSEFGIWSSGNPDR